MIKNIENIVLHKEKHYFNKLKPDDEKKEQVNQNVFSYNKQRLIIMIETMLFAQEIFQNLLSVKKLIQKVMSIVFDDNILAIKIKTL